MFNSFNPKNYNCKEMPQETEQRRLVPSKVCKTSLIQFSMPCIHERILSTVGEVGLEVILNIAFFLFSPMP
jgi:hypothetical protein